MKTAVVTGANAGLGYAITTGLIREGYRVIMACRNEAKAAAARTALLQAHPNANLQVLPLDLSDLGSVENFAKLFAEQVGQLELLINNAGITDVPLARNAAGHEMQMATNYLGNFALIGRMLPYFNKEGQCRIVNVGSLAHRFGKLTLNDMNWERDTYKPMKSYARSKIALMTFTCELNRRLQGSNILVLGAHPGFAATEITKKNDSYKEKSKLSLWIQSKVEPLIPTPDDAARATLLAALSDDVKGGDYYGPGGFLEIGGKPAPAKLATAAKDPELGRKLWEISEQMTGVSYLGSEGEKEAVPA